METLRDKILNVLAVLPVILMVTFTNVIVSFVLAGVTIWCLRDVGWTNKSSLVIGVLVAVAVHAYIYFQPKIRGYISARSSI